MQYEIIIMSILLLSDYRYQFVITFGYKLLHSYIYLKHAHSHRTNELYTKEANADIHIKKQTIWSRSITQPLIIRNFDLKAINKSKFHRVGDTTKGGEISHCFSNKNLTIDIQTSGSEIHQLQAALKND